jgi:hypothetical protein
MGRAVPVAAHEGPWCFETSRLSHFLDNRLTDGGKIVSFTGRSSFNPTGRFMLLIYVRVWVDPRGIVPMEGFVKLKIFDDIGNRTRDLQARSIVPQRTILTHEYLSIF